ncbi:MAG: two-component regulator propeller domain-containing protein [Breznakibacter sp.]
MGYNKSMPNLGMTSDWITKLYCDSQNNIWACTWEGTLTLINKEQQIFKSWKQIGASINFFENSPFSFHESLDRKYWVGLWGKGVIKFSLTDDFQLKEEKHYNQQISNQRIEAENIIYDIDIDSQNDIWLGTPNGVVHILGANSNSPHFFKFSSRDSGHTPQYEAFSVLCDNSGLIWAGTLVGVNILDPFSKIFTPYSIPTVSESIISQTVTAFTYDPWGRLLVGVRSYGFGSYNLQTKQFVPFNQLEPYKKLNPELNTINCFLWDKDGYLWLGTRYLGVIKLDLRTGQSVEINKTNKQFDFEGEQVYDIVQDHAGYVWVGTDKGLYKIIHYSPVGLSNFSIVKYQNDTLTQTSISSDHVSKIIEDANLNIWVGTFDKGLNRLTSGTNTHIPALFKHYGFQSREESEITSNQIVTFYKDNNGTLWIGTAGGGLLKYSYQSDSFEPIEDANNTIEDAIFSITEDADSNLWIATNKGLVRIGFEAQKPVYSTFKQTNGLQSNNFVKNAVYRDKEGNIYFGGNKGFNYFSPKNIKPNPYVPPVAITEIKISNQLFPTPENGQPLELQRSENSFSVTFSALSYSQASGNKYATRLEGVDNEWRYTDATMRTVTYANLKPGTYTLYYTAANSNGLWNARPRQLTIVIHPAVYETWWAFTLYFVLISSTLGYITYKERKTNKIKQALEIEHIEHEKSEKLLDFKKQLFANVSNEFITPLNILHVYIEKWRQAKTTPSSQDLVLAQRNINRLIRYNQQFMYYSSAEFDRISLSISAHNFNEFINDVCGNFDPLMEKKDIQFIKHVNIAMPNAWFDIEKLDIILYNLLAHSIKSCPDHGTIELDIKSLQVNSSDFMQFHIHHSHIDLKDVPPDAPSSDGKNNLLDYFGIGFAITKQMIELHHGELQITRQPAQDTTYSFSIPVSKSAYPPACITPANKLKNKNIDYLKNQLTIEEDILTSLKNFTKDLSELPTIIIIEQDTDLRKVLKNNLSQFFNIKEAQNGQAGFTYLLNHSIDLVIVDAEMPGLSGIDICKKLRSTPQKMHIPLILLSGQASENERTMSYKFGADSYIPKPFNINTLLSRIQNLIEKKQPTPVPLMQGKATFEKAHQIPSDDKFLNEVKEVVEKNLADPSFNVKQLASELNISNSMLYRKLSDSIQLNPNAFIKKIRLMKATELLESSEMSISEIAYSCGFSDVSYFGYAFKKDFGIPPTSYQRNLK